MILLSWCDHCENITGMKGFIPTYRAFPDGIPYDFDNSKDHQAPEVCHNGIGYEEGRPAEA